MKTLLLYGILLISLITACNTEISDESISPDSSTSDYLLVGKVGLGWGCSAVRYKLQDGKLYADTSSSYCKNRETYVFKGYQLSDAQYQRMKDLPTSFPNELNSLPSQTFGCPGCADGGMLFIQKKTSGGVTKTWLIDDSILTSDPAGIDKTFPDYLINYAAHVYDRINTL